MLDHTVTTGLCSEYCVRACCSTEGAVSMRLKLLWSARWSWERLERWWLKPERNLVRRDLSLPAGRRCNSKKKEEEKKRTVVPDGGILLLVPGYLGTYLPGRMPATVG